MCGYADRFWARYQQHWLSDKLEAAEHTIENQEAELRRHRKFISERRLTVQWIQGELKCA